MNAPPFIVIGENIHCTRVFKREGKSVERRPDGREAIVYTVGSEKRYLPVPPVFENTADWEGGKVKHCSVAVWQGMYGDEVGKKAGIDYLQTLSRKQVGADASFLDVNVDEFSADVDERIKAMRWAAKIVQQASVKPLSIDSSNTAVLRAGLEACEAAKGQPMVNSVSLERASAVEVAAEFKAAVVASAAGEKDLPCTAEERLANLGRLMPKLLSARLKPAWVYVDPLVFPIATDSNNGRAFLDAVAAIRGRYGPEIHVVGGLSNVSYGMPSRKLINQVFTYLAVRAGADGGIVDPLQINGRIIAALDVNSEEFRMAKALLVGEDAFGVEFIMAHREGRLKG